MRSLVFCMFFHYAFDKNHLYVFMGWEVCPECIASTKILYDDIHDEHYCEDCGLIIEAPPIQGITFPGMKILRHTLYRLDFSKI